MFKRSLLPILLIVLLILTACKSEEKSTTQKRLTLATTTSTEDSGLLDYILPTFEKKYNVTVDVVAVGTGQAIALGEAGDADVLLVHARSSEDSFVEQGYAQVRYDVMYNDFVIVGPTDDPAGIAGMEDATLALTLIADSGATFVSRGDDSGTHIKEQSLWEQANLNSEGDWYLSAGQGMGAVLTITEELQGYTLTDRATYLARQAEGLDLVVLVEGDARLFNPYGVMAVNPEKYPEVQNDLAEDFIAWLLSAETQERIATYQVNGQQLFFPNSDAWHAQQAKSGE